ncbi:uncharacterized protein VTP21DRAFT_10318 [Calcarisporiella thermophila]|uniref:uncharacterized protein n=1 Tax=Calcarisporiella thermophila TaxID=911321 RepID=UPI0037422F57
MKSKHDNEESEYEEETTYVVLDLGKDADPELLRNSDSYSLIGIDTPTPYFQIGPYTYKGHFDEVLGTELLFEPRDTGGVDTLGENASNANKSAHYIGHTTKKIMFSKVELQPLSKTTEVQKMEVEEKKQ